MTTSAATIGALEFERKYLVGRGRRDATRHCLGTLCRPDPKHPVGVVASIYFDTPGLRLLDEKVDSQLYKTKVRLRWYETPAGGYGDDVSFLEVKTRIGSRRAKWRQPIDLSPRWLASTPLTAPALREIPERLDHDPTVTPRGLSPVLTVRYLRHRYRDPSTGVRIALDQAIEVSRVNPRFLADLGARQLPQTVLEIKSDDGEPPANLHFLRGLDARLSSYSKYHAAFRAAAAPSLAGIHTPLNGQVA